MIDISHQLLQAYNRSAEWTTERFEHFIAHVLSFCPKGVACDFEDQENWAGIEQREIVWGIVHRNIPIACVNQDLLGRQFCWPNTQIPEIIYLTSYTGKLLSVDPDIYRRVFHKDEFPRYKMDPNSFSCNELYADTVI